nr:fibronectin type III domain-containing protein [Chloroflexota bacterium]
MKQLSTKMLSLLVILAIFCLLNPGGQISPTQAQHEGWCCYNNEVFSYPEAPCLEMGGRFFRTQAEAVDYCQRQMPPLGWCCCNNQVFSCYESECLEMGGGFFRTSDEANEYCRRGLPDLTVAEILFTPEIPWNPEWQVTVEAVIRNEGSAPAQEVPVLFQGIGWEWWTGVAYIGPGQQEVIPMSGPAGEPGERPITVIVDPGNLVKELNEGNNERTRYFVVQAQEGWCCYNNDVFFCIEPQCLEMGGRFFGTQEEAEDFCRAASMPPTITITAPKEGETWVAGSTHEIRWFAEGGEFDLVTLSYSTDGWATWEELHESKLNEGTYEWQVPAELSGDCWVGAAIWSAAGESLAGASRNIFVETAWATQVETTKHEILGSSDGNPAQTFSLTRVPVIFEEVWVNEMSALSEGEMKNIIEKEELKVKPVRDEKGSFTEFWIKWQAVDHLLGSSKDDRHYEIDRTSGNIRFGDGVNGKIPPIGTDNIKANYRSGGGKTGAGEPTITITAPQEGETWVAGSTYEIRWETTGPGIATVGLGYSTDEGATWVAIAEGQPTVGTYQWQVPTTLSGDCSVVAGAKNAAREILAADGRHVFVQAQALPGPDLIITDVWNKDGTICYQVRNTGGEAAAGGHYTGLLVDGDYTASDRVDADLQPGERWKGCFDYRWKCSPREDNLVVWADYEDGISESDETNNRREENWKCDTAPPGIISGPTVLDITQNSVVITWKTNEDSDSVVKYGKKAELYASEEADTTQVRSHSITLADLDPSTTYHFSVQSSDTSGNAVQSKGSIFETSALPDDTAPTISLVDPGICRGTVTFSADVSDDTWVEKVRFYLDNKVVFTDYSPPYEFTTDTAIYKDGKHPLKGKVSDLSGNSSEDALGIDVDNLGEASGLTVEIIKPKDLDEVWGKVGVKAELEDDKGVFSACFYVDGEQWESPEYFDKPYPKSADVTFIWNTKATLAGTKTPVVKDGWHQIAIQAEDTEGHKLSDRIKVKVVNKKAPPPPSPGYPDLEVTGHTVSRKGNRFTITLTVKNVGDAVATNIKILDMLQAFQPIQNFNLPSVKYSTWFNPKAKWGYCEIRPQAILAGKEHTYSYDAVAVLIYPNPPAPEIGSTIDISWTDPKLQLCSNIDNKHEVKTTKQGEPIAKAHEEGVRYCDYLILTDTYRLFGLFSPSYGVGPASKSVNSLLSAMAELAWHKKGVLGYFDSSSIKGPIKYAIHDLIKLGGEWSGKLPINWCWNGYLLIVGETEIIPSWGKTFGTTKTTKGDTELKVITDYPYASTYGSRYFPELSIGRVIGNNAVELRKPIQTSIDVYDSPGLPSGDYLLVSGYPGCLSGGCDFIYFKSEVAATAFVLSAKLGTLPVMTLINTPDYLKLDTSGTYIKIDETATIQAIRNKFFTETANKDVIFLAGHGNASSWDVIDCSTVLNQANPFGPTNPFVFASSCSTGMYFGNTVCLAEAFLSKGAAAYLGATQFGLCPGKVCPNATTFFSKWDKGEPVGLAVKQTTQSLGSDLPDRWWMAIYHLFGDPKFVAPGVATSGTTTGVLLASLTPHQAFPSLPAIHSSQDVTGVSGENDAKRVVCSACQNRSFS